MQPRYFLLTLFMGLFSFSINVQAQISTDGTLGPASTLSGPDYQIGPDLGQQLGNNLFHSFRDFNIRFGESATFSGPDSVNNIISRVTGGNPSRINGLFRSTIPNADVYFLNPYGILFGEGASLDVQGSFHASTADYLRLKDGGRFDARQPSDSLLTVAPIESFGFLTDAPGAITVEDSFLSVSEGKTLSLIGGELDISNADLFAESGQINLASIFSEGEIVSTSSGLNISAEVQFGQITVDNTWIDVSGEKGGSIFIRSGLFKLINNSIVDGKTRNKDGGIINIQVDNLELQDSGISSSTLGIGKGGSIVIQVTDVLTLSNSEQNNKGGKPSAIVAHSLSEDSNAGESGNINVEARQITLMDGAQIGGGILGTGKGNTVVIKADNLTLQNGASITASTFGPKEGGSIIIKITDTMTLYGIDSEKLPSSIMSNSGGEDVTNNTGKAGNIEIEARQIILTDGAQISTSTWGHGEGGSVTIKVADTLTASGTAKDNYISSGIFSDSIHIGNNGGNAGNVDIEANDITLLTGAKISSDTVGSGNGGTITINAKNLMLMEGAQIVSWTSGTGKGGSINIKLSNALTASGYLQSGNGIVLISGIFGSSLHPEIANAGKAGDIKIEAEQIGLENGALIVGDTFGTGQGGTITIISDRLTMFGSVISTNSENPQIPNAGKAGNIKIEAEQITLENGTRIGSDTKGSGQGGMIIITANDLVLKDGATVVSGTLGTGNGGTISINSDALRVSGFGSGIFGSSLNPEMTNAGKAGNIDIQARQITLNDGTQISSDTRGSGKGGTVTLLADNLVITEGSQISTNTWGTGKGGSITVEVLGTLMVSGYETDENGTVVNSGIFGSSQNPQLPNAGKAGNIEIQAHQITLNDRAQISSDTKGSGKGGMMTLLADNLVITDGSQVVSGTFGSGDGGTISIISDALIVSGLGSGIFGSSLNPEIANAGKAGNVNIQARQITLNDGAQIGSDTRGFGEGGSITIEVLGTLMVSGYETDENGTVVGSGIFGNSQNPEIMNAGKAGNIEINSGQITLTDGARISSDTIGTGEAGAITIVSDTLTASGFLNNEVGIFGSGVFTNSENREVPNAGKAGNIKIQARQITLNDRAQIGSDTKGSGKGGTMTLLADNLVIKNGAQVVSGTFGSGDGGSIAVEVLGTLMVSEYETDENGTVVSSGIFGSSNSSETNAGNAGEISVTANTINLTERGQIVTTADNAAGGNITIKTPAVLYLRQGIIATEVIRDDREVNAGHITIEAPVFVVLDEAQIITKARRGFGGDITINSQQFLASADKSNVLDASSDVLERSGNIVITAPDEDISGSLIGLAMTPINADDLLRNLCAGVTRRTLSKFIVIDRNVPPKTPADTKSHYIRRADAPKPEVMPEQLF